MSRLLIFPAMLLSLLTWSWCVLGQTQVTGMADYVRPEYLILPAPNGDPLGALGHWRAELMRAGFQLITYKEFEDMVSWEARHILLAEVLSAAGEAGVERGNMWEVVRARGENWYSGYAQVLEDMLRLGEIETYEVVEQGRFFERKTEMVRWIPGTPLPVRELDAPHTFHLFSYYYTYRESLSCGRTFSETHGSINEVSGGQNIQLVAFNCAQAALGSDCPSQIIARLAKQMTPAQKAATTAAEVDVKLSGDSEAVAAISTIVLAPKPGDDCDGHSADEMIDMLALGLLETFDIVDRSVLELALAEQELAMTGLLRDADLVEAGALAGAEGILTLQAMCLSGHSMLKAKLISAESSLLLLSAIGTNASASEVAAGINLAHKDANASP